MAEEFKNAPSLPASEPKEAAGSGRRRRPRRRRNRRHTAAGAAPSPRSMGTFGGVRMARRPDHRGKQVPPDW